MPVPAAADAIATVPDAVYISTAAVISPVTILSAAALLGVFASALLGLLCYCICSTWVTVFTVYAVSILLGLYSRCFAIVASAVLGVLLLSVRLLSLHCCCWCLLSALLWLLLLP